MEIGPPASHVSKESADYPVFVIREFSMFNVGPKIVKPPQSATFPAPLQSWSKTNHPKYNKGIKREKEREREREREREVSYKRKSFPWNGLISVWVNLTSFLWESNPIPSSPILLYIRLKLWVFFRWPWPLLHICLVTTRSPPHSPLCLISLSSLSLSLTLSLSLSPLFSLLPSFLLSLSSLLSISLYFRGTKGLRTLCGAAAFY